MTGCSLKSITPDGITGMIFALEGMKNALVLLNGPMGCRFYHSTTSQHLSPRGRLKLPPRAGEEPVPVDYNTLNDFFFRQERVPSTYLDGYDYVYGTKEKVAEALRFVRDNVDFDLLGIVNSPGAALIGDDLLGIARELLGAQRVVMLESSGYSVPFEEGYAHAMDAMLRQLGPSLWPEKSERKPKTVNLLGISIWHRYWEGDLQELKRLLSLCGVEVIAAPGAACSIEELKRMPEAALNVVLEAAMGLPAAEFLEEIRGTPFYVCPGLPVGFSATERIFREVCTALGVSPEPVLTESEKARARAWFKLSGVYESSGKPKGVKFAVVGTPAQEKAFSAFLTDYLAMSRTGPEEAELVFANANVISELMLKNKTFCGIEIGLPGMGYVDLTLKTQLGISGSLFLIEQVINGLMSRL